MHRGLPMVALVVLLAAPLAAPQAPALDAYARLEALAVERSGGDLGRQGVMVVHGPDGPVERAITGHEFLALAGEFLDRAGGPQADDAIVPAKVIGFGFEHPMLAPIFSRLGWPYCDVATSLSAFSLGGSPIKHAAPMAQVLGAPVCGGGYGATTSWADVTFDVHGLTAAGPGICVDAMVMMPLTLEGASCGHQVACASGNGVLFAIRFFSLEGAYFVGQAAVVVGGDESMDAMSCVPGLSLLGD